MKTKHPLLCISLVSGTILSGCSSGFPGARPLTYSTPGEARLFVSANECPHVSESKEFLPAAVLVTAIGSQLLTNFGAALAKGAEAGKLSPEAATLNMMPDSGAMPKCIVIIRGEFDKTDATSQSIEKYDLFSVPSNEQNMKIKVDNLKIPAVYRADYVIETRLMMSNNKKAIKLAPVYFRFNRSIDGDTSGTRDMTVTYDFTTPGGNKSGSVLVIRNKSIGGQEQAFGVNDYGNYTIESPWFTPFNVSPTLPSSKGVKPDTIHGQRKSGNSLPDVMSNSDVKKTAKPDENNVLPTGSPYRNLPSSILFSDKPDAMPVTLSSTIVETRPTNEGLAFIASVFTAVKPDIENSIKESIDPETIKKTSSEISNAESTYLTALGEAKKAELDYCTLSQKDNSTAARTERIMKSAAAGSAQAKANSAAIIMGKTYEFTSIIPVSDSIENIQNYCD